MLTIKGISSSSDAVAYYSGGMGQQDYLEEGGEAPGVWAGVGAKRLGLVGEVGPCELEQLLLGYSADGETKLVQNAGRKKRKAGFDCTWSVPKSVSVAWSQGTLRERLELEVCIKRALGKSLELVQEICGKTRRGKAGERVEDAGLVLALFRHETARGMPGEVPDPQLHFHSVLLNVVARDDGTTGALDARELLSPKMKLALGTLFRVELSAELESLGLETCRPFDKEREKLASSFELAGVTKEQRQAFSKRREAIEAWLDERGLSGAVASEVANLQTRAAKERWNRGEMLEAWRKLGRELGYDREAVWNGFERKEPGSVQQAVSLALTQLTEHRSTFSKVELLRAVAEESQSLGLRISDVREGLEEAIRSRVQIIPLRNGKFSTKELRGVEWQLFEIAHCGRDAGRQVVKAAVIDEALGRYPTIRDEQAKAVRFIAEGRDSIHCVNGLAGTGKTFSLQVARECFEQSGFHVLGTALSANAAKALQEGSGIESLHLHKLLFELEAGRRSIRPRSVIVLDEAGMVGTKQMERLARWCEKARAKLVLVGDVRQVQAVNAGSPFRGLSQRLGVFEMKEIIRQKELWARESVKEVAEGKAEAALKKYAERNLLFIGKDRREAFRELQNDWWQVAKEGLSGTQVFVATRREARRVNELCQAKRRQEEGVAWATEGYLVGDRVVCTKNNHGLVLRNGMQGTVVSGSDGSVDVQFDDGVRSTINLAEYEHLELGFAITTHRGQGQTVENSLVLLGGSMTDREMSYVQISRARGTTRIYADRDSGGDSIERLASMMNRSRPKELVLDREE